MSVEGDIKSTVMDCFIESAQEARDLYIPSSVDRVQGAPTPLEFHKKWVSKNIPCIFQNTISHWAALKNWNLDYLTERLGNKAVSVAVTPNGLADAVTDGCFLLPEERSMPFKEFANLMKSFQSDPEKEDSVYYIQKQNSNLTTELSELLPDIDSELQWAADAFSGNLDAVNFWFGQARAVTSLHKDPYENIYCVVKGSKTFTIYPPSDRPFIPYREYLIKKHKYNNGNWAVVDYEGGENKIPWIPVDPLKPDLDLYPNFAHAKPLVCTIRKGEVFYLPALWFHHVQQTEATIAVNYWYDMEFDLKFNYYQTLDSLCKRLKL